MVVFAAEVLAGAFLAGAFLAGALVADAFFAVVVFAAVVLAGAFFAADVVAGAFFAVVLAGDSVAGAAFFAVVDRLPGVAFLATEDAAAAAFWAGAVAFLAAGAAAETVSLGSFLAPETTFFRSAPGVNFGTAFFLARILSPVCGLRTVRAARTRFSNEPKPVIATFSPFATSRVIVSRTDSSACAAALRFPS